MRISPGWWVAAAIVLFMTGVSWLTMETRRGGGLVEITPTYSTYAASPGGAKGLFVALEEEGRKPLRLRRPWTELPPEVKVLVVPPPIIPVADEEWEHLETWLRRGGRLVYTPEGRGLRERGWETVEGIQGEGVLEGVEQLAVYSLPEYRDEVEFETFPLIPQVLDWARREDGAIYVLHDPEIYSNAGILRKHNLRLVLNLLEPGNVAFDEYHLGRGQGDGRALWKALPPGTRSGMLHLGLGLLILAWALSRRAAAPRDPLPPPRERSEYLESMAGLLRRAGAVKLVLRMRRRGLAEALDRALKLGPGATDAERLDVLGARDPALRRELEELLRAMEHPPGGADSLLALAARERDLLEKVRRAR